ncbi:uncharacterized protein [Branchiostoma lanceolatum]|uniref:uncharacterized protein n=1 Tax=Branchiostoma lanceolatum TaxID=7740 RepID=UPI0034550367
MAELGPSGQGGWGTEELGPSGQDGTGWLGYGRVRAQRTGWNRVARVRPNSLTAAQAGKIRRQGMQKGTHCQHSQCKCANFCAPSNSSVKSASRQCTECQHLESDHRVPTKFDQQLAREQAQADRTSCVLPTCNCQGFLRPTSQSFALLGPRQCATCQHGVTLHRPQTAVDELIVQRVAESGHLRCQTKVGRDEAKKLQVLAEEGGCGNFRAFEPVTIRHLEEEDADQAVEKQRCPCPGFSAGDLQKLLKQYHGLNVEIVGQVLQGRARCPSCQHALQDHRPQTEKEAAGERELTSGKTHLLRAVTFATPKPDLSTACCYLDRDQLGKISIATKGTNEDLEQVRVATVSLPMVQQQAVNKPAGEQESSKDEKKKKRGKKRKKEDISMETETRDEKSPSSPVQVRWDEAGCAAALPGLEERGGQVQFTCDSITCLAFGTHRMQDGGVIQLLACGRKTGDILVKDTTGQREARIPRAEVSAHQVGSSQVTRLEWLSQDAVTVLVSAHRSGRVHLWQYTVHDRVSSLVEIASTEVVSTYPTALKFSPAGKYLAVGFHDSKVCFYTLNLRAVSQASSSQPVLKPVCTCEINYGAVRGLAWHPHKSMLSAVGEDDKVTMFYMRTPEDKDAGRGTIMHYFGNQKKTQNFKVFQHVCALKGHVAFSTAVAFHPSGQFLVSAGWDSQVLYWSTTDVENAVQLNGDTSQIEPLCGFVIGRKKSAVGRKVRLPLEMRIVGQLMFLLLQTELGDAALAVYSLPRRHLPPDTPVA